MKKILLENKKYLKLFIIISLIYMICILGIIRANAIYKSDILNVFFGDMNFNQSHQYFVSIFIRLFQLNKYVNDITPLTQMLSILCLAAVSTILIKLFKNNYKISVLNILSTIPVGLSPYMLGCISYKIGALYISFAILMCVLPYLFIKDKKIFAILSLICIFIVFTTYASVASIYLILGIFIFLKNCNTDGNKLKKCFKELLLSFVYFTISLTLFIIIICFLDKSWSLEPHRVINIMNNFKNIFSIINHDFGFVCMGLIIMTIILFIIENIVMSKQNFFISFIIVISCLLLAFILIPGIYILYNNMNHTSQFIVVVGIVISLICLNINIYKLFNFPHIVLSVIFIIMAFVYGNTLYLQNQYITDTMESVFSYLDQDIVSNDEIIFISVRGNVDKPTEVKRIVNTYPVFERLIATDNIFPYEKYSFIYYYGDRIKIEFVDKFYKEALGKEDKEEKEQINEDDFELLIRTNKFLIKKLDDKFIVEFINRG